jgi:gamma-glutamyltranspeptidase/glutathione hydrolase
MTYFQSRRSSITARRGIVATSQPLAAQVGLRVLMEGGHAVDAAVATSAALGVVEPHMTGVGGDLFALVWDAGKGEVSALNASGRAGSSANVDDVRRAGFESMPEVGEGVGLSVTVPGTVDGWSNLLQRHGRMELSTLLAPAIELALDGYVVSEVVASIWQDAQTKLTRLASGSELLSQGRAPRFGEIVRLPELGATLQSIAHGGPDAFYRGSLAAQAADYVQRHGGCLTPEDFAGHQSTWDEPISTDYRGTRVWECPPNGQGLAALLALNMAEKFDLTAMGAQSVERYHTLIECMRLSFADAFRYIADPRQVEVPTQALLAKQYATDRAASINSDKALGSIDFGNPHGVSDTVYLTVVDSEGNACSLINSLYAEFGSGLVVPGTGMALQNRGANFTLEQGHLNVLEGGKRPYQTIIPALATRDGELWLSFGVMGGHQQPQGHLQVISNMVDFEMEPQRALDALRFRVDVAGDGAVELETGVPAELVAELERRGHTIRVIDGYERSLFGGGQVISRDAKTGALVGGSEPRIDGAAVGW